MLITKHFSGGYWSPHCRGNSWCIATFQHAPKKFWEDGSTESNQRWKLDPENSLCVTEIENWTSYVQDPFFRLHGNSNSRIKSQILWLLRAKSSVSREHICCFKFFRIESINITPLWVPIQLGIWQSKSWCSRTLANPRHAGIWLMNSTASNWVLIDEISKLWVLRNTSLEKLWPSFGYSSNSRPATLGCKLTSNVNCCELDLKALNFPGQSSSFATSAKIWRLAEL
jgi:hypothetical protein